LRHSSITSIHHQPPSEATDRDADFKIIEKLHAMSQDKSTQSDMHFYEPANGHGLRHNPLNSIIAPRPIGWISSVSADGINNLAPYSFFNAFNYVPPIIGFSSIGYKDSVRNIERSGNFGWSLVTMELSEAMNKTSADVAATVDEFALAGVTPAASHLIAAPRVAESLVSFECRLTELSQLKNARGDKLDTWLVLGEVVGVHIRKSAIVDGLYDTARAGPIARGGGPADYFSNGPENLFKMRRP